MKESLNTKDILQGEDIKGEEPNFIRWSLASEVLPTLYKPVIIYDKCGILHKATLEEYLSGERRFHIWGLGDTSYAVKNVTYWVYENDITKTIKGR